VRGSFAPELLSSNPVFMKTGVPIKKTCFLYGVEEESSEAKLKTRYLFARFLSLAGANSDVAEGEGFEPSMELPPYHLSKMAH
jgi:hypothetical protein